MLAVSGELQAGEARRASAAIAARQRGSVLSYYLILAASVTAGGVVGYALGWAIKAGWPELGVRAGIAASIGAWVGLIAYSLLGRVVLVRRFRKRMASRGFSVQFPYTLTLTDEALTLVSGPVRGVAEWRAVTELFKAKGYWIFLVHMNSWFAPSRFFESEGDEKAFVRAALSHMSSDALARSRQAVAFASE
jgi:hypothetical protein